MQDAAGRHAVPDNPLFVDKEDPHAPGNGGSDKVMAVEAFAPQGDKQLGVPDRARIGGDTGHFAAPGTDDLPPGGPGYFLDGEHDEINLR